METNNREDEIEHRKSQNHSTADGGGGKQQNTDIQHALNNTRSNSKKWENLVGSHSLGHSQIFRSQVGSNISARAWSPVGVLEATRSNISARPCQKPPNVAMKMQAMHNWRKRQRRGWLRQMLQPQTAVDVSAPVLPQTASAALGKPAAPSEAISNCLQASRECGATFRNLVLCLENAGLHDFPSLEAAMTKFFNGESLSDDPSANLQIALAEDVEVVAASGVRLTVPDQRTRADLTYDEAWPPCMRMVDRAERLRNSAFFLRT